MKKIKCTLLLFSLLISAGFSQNNVGIGTNTPDTNAILEMHASDKGVLIPRMTSTQRNNISPSLGLTQKGLLVFDYDSTKFFYWNGSAWQTMGSGAVGPTGPVGPSGSITIIHSDYNDSTSNASPTNQILNSWTLPANTLATNGSWIEIEAFGTVITPNGNMPVISIRVGGVPMSSIDIYNNGTLGSFYLNAKFYRISNLLQKFSGIAFCRASMPHLLNNATSLNLSTNLLIEIWASAITVSDIIIVKGFTVRKVE